MLLAIDVHYRSDFAKVVAIEFNDWTDDAPAEIRTIQVEQVADYVPGQFYKRELPCILEILEEVDQSEVALIIVDGYVYLDDEGKAGLGKHLFDALNQAIPVIGVAKRSFINNQKHVIEVLRGESDNPLYITSIGMDVAEAAEQVKHMAGPYRMPDLLRILDQETKA